MFTSHLLVEAVVILETIPDRHLATLLIRLAEVRVQVLIVAQDLQLDLLAVVVQIALDHQVEEEDVVKILRK